MLKSNKVKIIIGAFIALCVLAASSIWVMNYKNPNEVEEFSYTNLAASTDNQTASTQIDYIVENSLTDGEDSYYNVYIITNGVTDVSEAVKNFIGQSGENSFQQVIINDNRTISATMADNKIRCVVKTVSELNALSYEDLGSELGNADLIYIYAASSVAYENGTDFSEDLYKFLHDDYAFSSNGKPLIMSYGLANEGGDNDAEETIVTGIDSAMYKLTSSTFKYSYRYSHTTNVPDWTIDVTDAAVVSTLQEYIVSPRSLYSQYQATTAKKPDGYTWSDYWKRTGTDEPTLNALYIYGDTLEAQKDQIQSVADWMVSDGQSNVFTGSSENYPTKAVVTSACAEDLTAASFYTDDGVKKYDFIFIAPDTYAKDINDESLAELVTLSKDSNTYILFGTLTGETVTTKKPSTSIAESLTINTDTNFGKLLDLSITTTGYAKPNASNVLVVGTKYMDTLAARPDLNQTKIATIVSLINKSTYRNHAGSSAGGSSGSISTTAYRVLELQPSYPIDLTLAYNIKDGAGSTWLPKFTSAVASNSTIKGNYYTIPSNVLNTNEIDNYLNDDGTMSAEYYQWDLSKAKIAYILNSNGYSGITADQIDLVQMSTEEYITAKTDVSDAYDLIYIGGNMSALRSSSTYGIANWGVNSYYSQNRTAFSMYSHNNSELTWFNNTGRISVDSTYAITLANDITYDRLLELESYIDSGMPIVFSNEVWAAYEKACSAKYKNKYIDPDSNMFKLCEYANKAAETDGNTSVLRNWAVRESYNSKMGYAEGSTEYKYYEDYFVSIETKVDNEFGFYGSSGSVWVFGTDDDQTTLTKQLYDCIYGANTSQRPKFTMDTTAISYVESDSSTKLESRDLTWDVSLLSYNSDHKYIAYILEDEDQNGVYDADESSSSNEIVTSAAVTGGVASLSYSYPDDDFGAFNWKILIVDQTTGASASYSDITVFKRLEDQPKKEATVLEIIEMKQSQCSSSNPTSPDSHTFYLDTNYQQSSGNPYLYSSFGTDAYDEYGWAPVVRNGNATSSDYNTYVKAYASNDIAEADKTGYTGGQSGNLTFGKYQPSLSIGRYDTVTGLEDRAYNYMDLISDDYDFTLDIMYMDDIEYFSNVANSSTEKERETYLEKATTAKANYDAYLTEGTSSYNQLKVKEDALKNCLLDLSNGKNVTCSNGTVLHPSDFNLYDVENIVNSGDYFRIFFLNSGSLKGNIGVESDPIYAFYKYFYTPYTDINDVKIKYYREYRYYNMMAYGPTEYLAKNYDVIVVGFSDPYENGKITSFSTQESKDLQSFATAGGSLLLTHDTVTNQPTASLMNMANDLRDFVGMDVFYGLEEVSGTGTTGYTKYSSIDSDRYFVTNLSARDDADLSFGSLLSGSAWDSAVKTWANSSGINVSPTTDWTGKTKTGIDTTGLTESFNIYYSNSSYSLRYKYAELSVEDIIKYNMQVTGSLNVTGTTKAEAVNRGVVTTYPFYIATDLRVSATHAQSYALDLENEDVTVWYTLAPDNRLCDGSYRPVSGTAKSGMDSGYYTRMKTNSSLYAASPKDGSDNYYIYSIGNVTYCGAGQALITGDERDNNDERRLFLNVLVNMSKVKGKAEKKPEIVLYDPDGVTEAPGKVVKLSDEHGYYIEVTSNVTYPEFGFKVTKGSSQKIENVQIFYDLDYNPELSDEDNGKYVDNDKHYLITLPPDILKSLEAGDTYVLTKENCPSLITQPSYFSAYDGTYTYLVIRVELSDGTILTKRIKVVITRNLLELT